MSSNLNDLKITTLIHLIESPEENSNYDKNELKAEWSKREILDEELKKHHCQRK